MLEKEPEGRRKIAVVSTRDCDAFRFGRFDFPAREVESW